MRVLIAEDDAVSRRLLESYLTKWGYETMVAHDGDEAGEILRSPEAPRLAILDWMMPGADGVELCKVIREDPRLKGMYVIMLTARCEQDDIVQGLEAGANDYIVKPFSRPELRARVAAAARIVKAEQALADRICDLEDAMAQIKTLRGLLPLCAWCRKVRDDDGYWKKIEEYVDEHSEATFTHGMCPACAEKMEAEAAVESAKKKQG